jgi:AGZA family xanthine/uracil permease-like MFS transporter
VNPMILADSGGTCKCDEPGCQFWYPPYLECLEEVRRDLVIVTAITSGIACILMGVAANLPFALAPGMGMNAYFTYGVVGFRGSGRVSYEHALGAVFVEGIIFMIASLSGLRGRIANAIPKPVRIATTGGIGMFLALLGMQTAEGIGFVVSDTATGLTYGGCTSEHRVPLYACPNTKGLDGVPDGIPTVGPGAFGLFDYPALANFTPWYDCLAGTNNVYTCDTVVTNWQGVSTNKDMPTFHGGGEFRNPKMMLGFFGYFLCGILMKKKIPGYIIFAVMFGAILSWLPVESSPFYYWNDGGSWDYFKQVVELRGMSNVFLKLEFGGAIFEALAMFFLIDFLDTSATLFSMADMAGFTKENGEFDGMFQAYLVDGFSTTMGAVFGTSPVTTYIESAPGILEGGRTGLTAVVVGVWFLISTLFAPILASFPPWTTGSALVLVGAMMMKGIVKINWEDPQEALPAFLTIITMPFTYSIAYGLILGIICWCVIAVIPPFPPEIQKLMGAQTEQTVASGDAKPESA